MEPWVLVGKDKGKKGSRAGGGRRGFSLADFYKPLPPRAWGDVPGRQNRGAFVNPPRPEPKKQGWHCIRCSLWHHNLRMAACRNPACGAPNPVAKPK
eukprot:14896589-Alexandrium_andersonii.AAC.1